MASKLLTALGQFGAPQVAPLSQATPMYTPAPIQHQPKPDKHETLINSIKSLAQMAPGAYGEYKAGQQEKASASADKLLATMPREEIDQHMKAGTLLEQDNPYFMKDLKLKLGRQAAAQLDSSLATGIAEEKFRTRDDLNKTRDQMTKDTLSLVAYNSGIAQDDPDFLAGFSSNVTERNVALYGQHDKFLANYAAQGMKVATQNDANNIIGDGAILKDPKFGNIFGSYLRQQVNTGAIKDSEAPQFFKGLFTDIASRPDGATAIEALRNETVTVAGKETTYGDLFGQNAYDDLVQTSNDSIYSKNRDAQYEWSQFKSRAASSADIPTALESVKARREFLNKQQPGEATTRQLDELNSLEASLEQNLAQQNAKRAVERDKSMQSDNRKLSIRANLDAAMSGQVGIPLSVDTMPSDKNTGEYKEEDFANTLNEYRNEIMADQSLTEQEKAQKWMKLASITGKTGWAQKVMAPTVTSAKNDLDGAIFRGGELKGDELDQLKAYYEADPVGFQKLYPEEGELLAKMYTMKKYGLSNEQFVKGERERNSLGKQPDKGAASYENFLTNSGQYPNLNYMSHDSKGAAYQVYLAEMNDHGDPTKALKATDDFMKDYTTTFSAGGSVKGGRIQGSIPTDFLTVGNDFKSADQGKAQMDKLILGMAEEGKVSSAYININYNADQDVVLMTGANGQAPKIITRGDLIDMQAADDAAAKAAGDKLVEKQRKEEAAKLDKVLKDANKRAPIAGREGRPSATDRIKAMNRKRMGMKPLPKEEPKKKTKAKPTAKAPDDIVAQFDNLSRVNKS